MASNSAINTQWLLNFPKDMRTHIANVYIESMEQDIALLKASMLASSDRSTSTLSIVHKIKGGTMQIGLTSIGHSAVYTENLGKTRDPEYINALSELIKDVEKSIADVTDWKNDNNK